MKARVWFEARGQSMRARGYPWVRVKWLMNLYALPLFAQSALARGHLNGGKSRAIVRAAAAHPAPREGVDT